MAQKVNPISLRLQKTNREFDNCWYTNSFYGKLVSRDIYLQQYINSFLKLLKYPSARFSIQYTPKNIKLLSFLCYPKQSRDLRSRMFGLAFSKKRKKSLKKRSSSNFIFGKQSSFRLHKKKSFRFSFQKNKSFFGPRQKTLKFLVDNRLWSRIYNPFSINIKNNEKRRSPFFSEKNQTQSLPFLGFFFQKNLGPFQKRELVRSKKTEVFLDKNQSFGPKKQKFFWKGKDKLFFLKQPLSPFGQNKQITKQRNKKETSQLSCFIKNLITSLFFIKILKKSRSSKIQNLSKIQNFSKIENFGQSASLQDNNFLYFNREYKKNLLKYFLVFYLLHRQYNKNENFESNSFLSKKTPVFLDCSFPKTYVFGPIQKLVLFKKTDVFLNQPRLVQKNRCFGPKKQEFFWKEKERTNSSFFGPTRVVQNFLNSLFCFSNFQPISIFNTTLQNTKPFHYLLQHNTSGFSNFKKRELICFDFLQGKKLDHEFDLNTRLSSLDKQKSLFYNVKKDQLQNLKYKNYVQHFLCSQYKLNTEFLPFSVSQDWQSAVFLADEIVYFLERRVPFRRLKKKIIKKLAENSIIRGVRISCSGRVGGKSKKAQRAKTECVKYGQTSRHTFSSQIDFAMRTARTIFGSVGIKVWISYN